MGVLFKFATMIPTKGSFGENAVLKSPFGKRRFVFSKQRFLDEIV
jgi:hypothetical protein